MSKDLAPIPIYAGRLSELDRKFREIQDAFRADSRLGPFSTFVKRATVEAWRRGEGRPQAAGLPDAIQKELDQLRREIQELRAARMMPAGSPVEKPNDEAEKMALDALGNLAMTNF